MPKHRSTVYTVVRQARIPENLLIGTMETWVLQTLIGTYLTLDRAEEVSSASAQHLIDAGMDKHDPDFRFTVHPSTWYEE